MSKICCISSRIITFANSFPLKGFCLPKELMEDSAGEGATQFHDYEGGGIGDGEGMKDVSERIENEEQVCLYSLCKMTLSVSQTC